MRGWLPSAPPFSTDDEIIALGSCFARELRNGLKNFNKTTKHLWMPAGLNNTFALRQFIEWVFEGTVDTESYWYDERSDGGAEKWMPNKTREEYKNHFLKTAGFVFTLGLSEVWCDKKTGGVFWRGVPQDIYDESKHTFRLSTVGENKENIEKIYSLCNQHCPGKPVIFTLSPVPLRATFREESCLTADCVSKSTLRVAIDESIRGIKENGGSNVYYWPSYEMVRWVPSHSSLVSFGDKSGRDSRHVNENIVDVIIKSFVRFYFKGD